MTHFALNGCSDVLPTSKGENKAFPPHPFHAMLFRYRDGDLKFEDSHLFTIPPPRQNCNGPTPPPLTN